MVVDKNHRGRGSPNRFSKNLAGVDKARGQGAERNRFEGDQSMATVEEQDMKRFAPPFAKTRLKMSLDVERTLDPFPSNHGLRCAPSAELDRPDQTRGLRRTESRDIDQARAGLVCKAARGAESIQNEPCGRNNISPSVAGSEDQRDQIGIR